MERKGEVTSDRQSEACEMNESAMRTGSRVCVLVIVRHTNTRTDGSQRSGCSFCTNFQRFPQHPHKTTVCSCLITKIIDIHFANHRDEYAIIPAEEQLVNKCPLLLIGGKLGIESWCLQPLQKYATAQMLLCSSQIAPEIDDITRILLMLNPEFATAWNVR